jgi:hypothetical protein
VVATVRDAAAASIGPVGVDPPVLEAPAAATGSLAAAPDPTIGGPLHAPALTSSLNGPGSLTNPLRIAIAAGDAKGFPDERASAGEPRGSDRGAGWNEAKPGVGGLATNRAGEALDVPDPQMADLITGFLPIGRASLESAIDRFLDPFDDLGAAMPDQLHGSLSLVPASLAVAVTVLALDVAIRLRRARGEETEADDDAGLVPFPGLPGLWRWSRP